MSTPPTPESMDRGGKGKTAIPEEEKADEPSILPMTPESKQLQRKLEEELEYVETDSVYSYRL